MKKVTITSLLLLILLSSLFSEKAFWIGFDPYDGSWDNSQLLSFTDHFEKGSEIMVSTEDGKTIIAKVAGEKPKTEETRDLGLTQKALEELGIWGNGVSEVNVKLRKGSVKEETEVTEETGWYSFLVEGLEREKSYDIYKILNRKGLKVETKVGDDDLVYFTVLYVASYEREEKRNLLSSLGLKIKEEIISPNPYIN